jgi:hypothetical protein
MTIKRQGRRRRAHVETVTEGQKKLRPCRPYRKATATTEEISAVLRDHTNALNQAELAGATAPSLGSLNSAGGIATMPLGAIFATRQAADTVQSLLAVRSNLRTRHTAWKGRLMLCPRFVRMGLCTDRRPPDSGALHDRKRRRRSVDQRRGGSRRLAGFWVAGVEVRLCRPACAGFSRPAKRPCWTRRDDGFAGSNVNKWAPSINRGALSAVRQRKFLAEWRSFPNRNPQDYSLPLRRA